MRLRIAMLLILTFGIEGCVTTARTVTDTFCFNYQPIRASRSDTAETLRQIKGQNAVYDRLCKQPVKQAAESMLLSK